MRPSVSLLWLAACTSCGHAQVAQPLTADKGPRSDSQAATGRQAAAENAVPHASQGPERSTAAQASAPANNEPGPKRFKIALCNAADRPASGSAVPSGPDIKAAFSLSAKVNVLADSQLLPRSIKPGDTAHLGDRFTLTAWSDQPAFLYVVEYRPDEWSTLLFPDSQHTQVPAQAQVRLPQRTPAYRLAGKAGEVGLLLYASQHPIDEKACELLRLPCPLFSGSGKTRGGSEPPNRPPPPKPPSPPPQPRIGQDRSQRNFTLVGQEYVATTHSEPDGTALLPFCFLQEP